MAPARRAASGTARRTVVLIVDDDDCTRQMCGDILEDAGFRILEASDGMSGVAKAVEHRPDVILMDLGMPIMGGLEATGRLAADERTSGIPVVVLTGSDVSQEASAIEMGASAYLLKPCTPGNLESVLRSVLPTCSGALPRRRLR